MSCDFDALIVVSFGGPERPEDVMPFLENVTRGRNIPRDRLLDVAEHYYHFGGKSPINDQNRAIIAALRELLGCEGPHVPVYWGNRNWEPYLKDTLEHMRADGIKRAAAFITSAFGSYSGCRQYLDDIARAQAALGEGAPEVVPLSLFYDQPRFLRAVIDHTREALEQFDTPPHLAFTAHSVPLSMSTTSPYVKQLDSTCARVADALGLIDWKLVYQSRSGPPTQPWLEPDILDHIKTLHRSGRKELVICPVGFISDHMEVIYDLDTEAAALCEELGVRMVRAATASTHPEFIRMIRDLMVHPRRCPADCCPAPQRPPVSASGRPPAPSAPAGS